MNVRINGESDTLERDSLSVLELLKLKDVQMPDMVSVQVNGEILDRDSFESTTIEDGDEVEFLYFMGGGSSPVSRRARYRRSPRRTSRNHPVRFVNNRNRIRV